MSAFYDRMQSTASRLLTKYKQGAVVYNAPGSDGDPFNPPTPGQSYPVSAVQQTYIDGGYIVATDILLAVAPFEVEPTLSGTMTINGETYQIVMVDSPTVLPADGQLVWFVGCRK
jgi:hypothetical protein